MWGNVLQGSYKSLLWMDTLLKTKVWMLVTVIWETRVIKVGCLFACFCFLLCSSVSLSVSWEEESFSSSSTCSLAAFSLIFSPLLLLFLFASSSAFALLAFCLALPLREDEEEEEDIVIYVLVLFEQQRLASRSDGPEELDRQRQSEASVSVLKPAKETGEISTTTASPGNHRFQPKDGRILAG